MLYSIDGPSKQGTMRTAASSRADSILSTNSGPPAQRLLIPSNTVEIHDGGPNMLEPKYVDGTPLCICGKPHFFRVVVSLTPPSIVAVPGLGTPAAETWGIDSELRGAGHAIDSVSRFHNYTYQSAPIPKEEFSWSKFLQTGRDLAEELATLANKVRLYK